MLAGNWVSEEIRGAAGFNSFECKILSLDDLAKFALEHGGVDMLEVVRGARARSSAEERDPLLTGAVSSSSRGRALVVDLPARPAIADMLRSVLADVAKGAVLSAHEIISAVLGAFPSTPKGSILVSDKCYNITNKGLSANYDFRIFELIDRSTYRFLGEGHPYSGYVTWKGERCGLWTNGVLEKWKNWPSR
jgi:hypothetical protein